MSRRCKWLSAYRPQPPWAADAEPRSGGKGRAASGAAAPCRRSLLGRWALGSVAAVLVLLASWRAPSVGAANTGIAVVVGPESSLTAASLEELKEYYLGERTNVPSGDTAQPTMRPAGSAEKEIFLRRIVGMSERDFKQHWLARIYRGESSSTPLVLDSDVSVRRYVTQVSSAIGYIDLNAQTTGLRVLLVIRDPQ